MFRRAKKCTKRPTSAIGGVLGSLSRTTPEGQASKREVEFEIKLEEGVVPPNKPPYRLSPKEHNELEAQIDTYSLRDMSALCRAPTEPQFYLYQRRMGTGTCVWAAVH